MGQNGEKSRRKRPAIDRVSSGQFDLQLGTNEGQTIPHSKANQIPRVSQERNPMQTVPKKKKKALTWALNFKRRKRNKKQNGKRGGGKREKEGWEVQFN